MARIKVIGEDEAKGKLFEVYDEIQRNRGRISNILRVQSLNPKALRAHLDLYMATVFGKGGLSRREAEVVALVVSQANGCMYSVTHHREALLRYAKDDAWVAQLEKDPSKATLTPREKALVDFALVLTKTPAKADTAGMKKAGLKDEELLQAADIIGYFNFVNRLALGLDVELEDPRDRDYVY